MKKLLHITKKILLLTLILKIFTRCENEQLKSSNQDNSITEIKSILRTKLISENSSTAIIFKNIEVNLNEFNKYSFKNIDVVEFKVLEKSKSQIDFKLLKDELKYEIVSLNNNNNIYFYLIEAFSSKGGDLYSCSLNRLNNFFGSLIVYNLAGEKLGTIHINNGYAIKNKDSNEVSKIIELINFFGLKNKTNMHNNCYSISTYDVENWIDYYYEWTTMKGEHLSTNYSHSTLVNRSPDLLKLIYPCESVPERGAVSIHRSLIIDKEVYTSKQEFLNDYQNTPRGIISSSFSSEDFFPVARATFRLLPWCGIDIIIQERKFGKKYFVQNLTSQSWGMILGFSWNQTTFSQNTASYITTINLYGNLTYTLYSNNIGNLYSQPVIFKININNRNGNIISGFRQ